MASCKNWIRQARRDAETWGQEEPPLGEEQELYQVVLFNGDQEIFRTRVAEPRYKMTDAHSLATRAQVAQISQLYGAGVARSLDLP